MNSFPVIIRYLCLPFTVFSKIHWIAIQNPNGSKPMHIDMQRKRLPISIPLNNCIQVVGTFHGQMPTSPIFIAALHAPAQRRWNVCLGLAAWHRRNLVSLLRGNRIECYNNSVAYFTSLINTHRVLTPSYSSKIHLFINILCFSYSSDNKYISFLYSDLFPVIFILTFYSRCYCQVSVFFFTLSGSSIACIL